MIKDRIMEFQEKWAQFQARTKENLTNKLLLDTLSLFDGYIGRAVDLGCGSGADTIELIKAGWEVCAIDAVPDGFQYIRNKLSYDELGKIEFKHNYFEELVLSEYDLVYSYHSIPFCTPKFFDKFWRKITNSINEGGRFAGTFFGEKDSYNQASSDAFYMTKMQVISLFHNFMIESYDEIYENESTVFGEVKTWHIYKMIPLQKHGFKKSLNVILR